MADENDAAKKAAGEAAKKAAEAKAAGEAAKKAAAEPVPPPAAELCDPSTRAANHPGQRRFKVRAKADGAGFRYVLAPDQAAAEARYRDAEPLATAGVPLVVTPLPD